MKLNKILIKQLTTIIIIVVFINLNIAFASGLRISMAEARNITARSATISWLTDEPANSRVDYGAGQLNQTVIDNELNTTHEIELTSLNRRTLYTARITSENANGTDIRPGLDILTLADSEVTNTTITTDIPTSSDPFNIPRAINTNRITISGITEPLSTIRFYVNSENLPSQIIETGDIYATSNAEGNFTATIQLYETVYRGILGYNNITIAIRDPSSNLLKESRIVVVDTTAPMISLDPIREFTNQQTISIKGALSEEAILSYVFGEDTNVTRAVIPLNDDLSFDQTIPLPGEGSYPLTIIATDIAGNEVILNYDIASDTTPCELIFTEETQQQVFSEPQRFSIVNLHADTSEPHCKVTVVNFKDVNPQSLTPEELDDMTDNSRLDLQLGIAGSIISGVADYESDDGGDIEITVALAQQATNQTLERTGRRGIIRPTQQVVGVNNIRFLIEDRAGNKNFIDATILFEPGSNIWKQGQVQTIPNTVYSNNLLAERTQGVDVGLIYDVFYYGPDTDLKNIRATARLDGDNYDNKHVYVKETFSRWYPDEGRLYVFTKLNVNAAGAKDVAELLESLQTDDIGDTGTGGQIDFSLVTTVNYDIVSDSGNSTDYRSRSEFSQRLSEDIYFKHAVGIETPFDYTRFLTPEMLKSVINVLDDAVEILEKMVEYADIATLGLTAGCVAMTAANYFTGSTPEQLDAGLKRTYYVCDRIWCPTIPADCAGVTRTATLSSGLRYVEKGGKFYQESDSKFENFVSLPSDRVTYSFEQNEGTVRTTYTWVDGSKAVSPIGTRICAPGENAVEIREQDTSQGSLIFGDYRSGYTSRGTQRGSLYTPYRFGSSYGAGSVRYDCVRLNEEQFRTTARPSDIGCYAPPGGPPQFHETKCFPDSVDRVNNNGDVNPYEDIFISTRCGCVSGVRGHLANILRITQGFQKCLNQAMIGEVRGAYCERLFAQFTCDMISTVVKEVMKTGKESAGFDSGEGFSVRENFQYVNQRLQERYGTIIKNRFGLSTNEIVHKACVAAITGDWTDLSTVFKQAGAVAVAPVIGPILPESRFNSYNPFTGEASINYYATLGILSGGQPVTGTFRIICDKSRPGGEYCPPDRPIIIYEEGIYVEPDGSLETNVFFTDENAIFWGNVAVLDLKYALGDQPQVQTIKEERINHKGPVLAQCHFSVLPPGFTCETIQGGTSAIEFQDAALTPKGVSRYYSGDDVIFTADLGIFGGLASGISPISGDVLGQPDQIPNVYLVYDLVKPNGQIETNRNQQLKLRDYLIPLDGLRKRFVFNPITFGEVGPQGYIFAEEDKNIREIISNPQYDINLNDGQSISLTARSTQTITAATIAGQTDTQKRTIFKLTLKNSQGTPLVCDVSTGDAFCKWNGESPFVPAKINYEIYASGPNDKIKFSTTTPWTPPLEFTELSVPRLQSSITETYRPDTTYSLNLTLYQDLFDPTSIDERDAPVGYGEQEVQSKSLSFTFAGNRNSQQSCSSTSTTSGQPKVEIVYPMPDEYISRSLQSASTSAFGGGVFFSVWDDCDSYDQFKSIRLFDTNGLKAAEEQIRSQSGLDAVGVEQIYDQFAIGSYSQSNNARKNRDAANLFQFTGQTTTPYLENDAFQLIIKVVDKHGNRAEDAVRVISSSSSGSGTPRQNREWESCEKLGGKCENRACIDMATDQRQQEEDDLGNCGDATIRCCRAK